MKRLRFVSILSFVNRWPDNSPAKHTLTITLKLCTANCSESYGRMPIELGEFQVIEPAGGQERDLVFTETRLDPRLSVDRRWISCG